MRLDLDKIKEELEYIDAFTDYYDETIIYKGKQAEEIKQALIEN